MIYGMLRVKNEARWIERVIRSLQMVCDGGVAVLDNGSTDGTAELCEGLGCLVHRSPFVDNSEARDKSYLLELVWSMGALLGDCVLSIDGDEILDGHGAVKEFARGGRVAGALRVLYLWDTEEQYRIDGVYRHFCRPSVFRLTDRDLSFGSAAMHCSGVPESMSLDAVRLEGARLLHLGYLHREDRVRKYEHYNRVDPGNRAEDLYRHTVIGDVFPVTARFKHGGPLKLAKV